MKNVWISSLLCAGAFACAAPQGAQPAPSAEPAQPAHAAEPAHSSHSGHAAHEASSLEEKVAQLEAQIADLNNRIGHLQTDIEAASPDNELTTMTIDGVKWSDQAFPHDHRLAGTSQREARVLLLHPVEWRGYGKMRRFTDKSDHVFYLEAHGKPPIEADALVGGVCNSDGSTRYVMVRPSTELEPGVTYRLRARNDNDTYKWSTPDALVVGPDTSTR